MPEAAASESDCILCDLIFALALAVNLDSDNVEHIEQHVPESLKRPGETVAFQPLQFLLAPRLGLGLGFAIAVQCSLFAVGVAHLDLYLLFIVGLETDHFQLNLHVLGLLLVKAAVRDNVDPGGSHDISIDRSNYDLIYTAPLSESSTVPEQLEKLYQQFNLEKPVDFHSPSMSVSDIVAIKQDGKVSCHYCDSVGFTQIPGFFSQNPLKNAEMTVEDDYGMIDGIINNGAKEPTVAELEQQARSGQPISLMDLAAATHREEREKKKSVVDQLKNQPKAEHKKTAPKKSAEREI